MLRATLLGHLPYFTIFISFWLAASIDQQLAEPLGNGDLLTHLSAALRAIGLALIVSTGIMALATDEGVERDFLIYFVVGTFVATLACRTLIRGATFGLRRSGRNLRRTLIIGSNDRAARFARLVRERSTYGFTVVGFLEDEKERCEHLERQNISCLGPIDGLAAIIPQESIDQIVILLPLRSFYERTLDIVKTCEALNTPALFAADLFPSRIAKNKFMYVEDISMVSLSAVPEERVRLLAKRLIDLTLSSILLLLLLPVLVVTALLVVTTSAGPVFFAQERVGKNQRRFKMIKFRSMIRNAESLRKELEQLNEADGPVFKIREDPRLTPIGGFIRKYSIDELPQLINVFLGQMSLVGPRPPLASEVEDYTWDQRRRLSVKPGMTGLWQVSGRSDIDFNRWVEMDLEYIDNWSLVNDFRILLKTFRAVIQGRGAA